MASVMKDYAEKDPRSVAASLRGTGDGRSEKWERFCESVMNKHHTVSDAQAETIYRENCKANASAGLQMDTVSNGDKHMLPRLVGLMLGVTLVVLVFDGLLHRVTYG